MTTSSETVREIFVTGLKNAHAVEHQALSLMDRQIEHLAHYAEIEQKLRAHRGETEQQIVRLEQILDSFGGKSIDVEGYGDDDIGQSRGHRPHLCAR